MSQSGSKVALYEANIMHLETLQDAEMVHFSTKSTAEEQYIQQSTIAKRKRYGQFFTPESIANVMADWVLGCDPKSLLDPAVGTGVLIRAISRHQHNISKCDVFDIDNKILKIFNHQHWGQINIRAFNDDFLSYEINSHYDAVIMNPPYLRHHDMHYNENMHDLTSKLVGTKISRSANSYVLFVMKACHYLNDGGRGAFIIPSEWVNANFGHNFKKYLMEVAGLSEILYFTNCSSIFDDALTTASILLVEKGADRKSISVSCVETLNDTLNYSTVKDVQRVYEKKEFEFEVLKSSPKWDGLFRYGETAKISGFVPLSDLGVSKRGIATGANEYFHVTEQQAYDLSSHHKKPCIGRSADVHGLVFSSTDFELLKKKGSRSILLDFGEGLNNADKRYIEFGESEELHKRYLLSKRKPWFSMEKREIAPIWAAVFGRKNLRFIYNEAQVHNLTTFHGFYPYYTDKTFIRALVCALNSEVVQDMAKSNMRVYGGGLLKFEPKDILDIQVPDIRLSKHSTLEKLASMLNEKIETEELNTVVLQAAEEATSSNA